MSPFVRMLPNLLTGSRIIFAGVFLYLLLLADPSRYPDNQWDREMAKLDWAFVLFVIAGLTDIIDGPLARKLKVTSSFGRRFDPLVDKILIGGGFLALILFFPAQSGLSWWMIAVILLREVFVTVVRHLSESQGKAFAATWAGKLKMFLQSFCIGTIICYISHFQDEQWAVMMRDATIWIAVVFTAFSAMIYWPRMKQIGKKS